MNEPDQMAMLRAAFPSYGPAWAAAIEYGIDVSKLTDFLVMTPEQRARRLRGSIGSAGMSSDVEELLSRLVVAGVEFVVVGDQAAGVHGSVLVTDGLDVTAPLTSENIRRLLAAVKDLNPRHALTLDKRRLNESAEHLASFKNLCWLTDLGRLDVQGTVDPIGSYEVVAQHAEETSIAGVTVRIISLEDLIAVKAHVGRPKDRHVELELRAKRGS